MFDAEANQFLERPAIEVMIGTGGDFYSDICNSFQRRPQLRGSCVDPAVHRTQTVTTHNPYVPTNMPAIGDLFDMFDFHGIRDQDRQR